MSEEIKVIVDVEDEFKKLDELDAKAQETKAVVNQVVEETNVSIKDSFNQVVGWARTAYTIGLSMVEASGISVSVFFKSLISASFGAIAILGPLITAKGLGTFDYVSMGLGLAELGLAISATIAAQAQQTKLAGGLRAATGQLGAISSLIAVIPKW